MTTDKAMVTDAMIAAAELKLAEVLAGHDYVMPLDGMQRVLRAALSEAEQQPVGWPWQTKYQLHQRVRKTKGSSWQGRIVGFYASSLTTIGYAVESEREPGSVQIYPEAALDLVPDEDALAHPPAKREAGETAAPVSNVEADFWTTNNNFENGSMSGIGLVNEEGELCWDYAQQEWLRADVPICRLPAPQPRERVSDTPSAALEASHE